MEISDETFARMEGLTSLSAQNKMIQAIDEIYTDLIEDGFDREEILEYFRLIIEGSCAPQ